MKKLVKRISAMLMAMTLILSMGMTAMAADDDGTITINGVSKGDKFSAYRILDVTVDEVNNENANAAYTVHAKYRDILKNAINALGNPNAVTGIVDDVIDAEIIAYITSNVTESTIRDFANEVRTKIIAAGVSGDTADVEADEDDSSIRFSDLSYGYWMVIQDEVGDNSAVSLCVLDTIAKDIEIESKSDKPTVEKKVNDNDYRNEDEDEAIKEDAKYGEGYNDVADYDIGDPVPFSFYSKTPAMDGYDTYKYIFHDTMSEGLTFDSSSVKVYIDGNLVNADAYDVIDTSESDGCTFDIAIEDLIILGAKEGDLIRVDFLATLNENAEIGLPGNPNTVKLEYNNDPYDLGKTTTTPEDKVIVFTFATDISKVDGKDISKELIGAEFKLYSDDNGTNEIKLSMGADGSYYVDPLGDAVITTDNNGVYKKIVIKGLDSGTYYLKETKAPDGYNLLTEMFKIEIEATYLSERQDWSSANAEDALINVVGTINGAVDASMTPDNGTVHAEVKNNSGTLLPGTGGIGTTIFYAVGLVLMLAAAAYFVFTKKRTNKETN